MTRSICVLSMICAVAAGCGEESTSGYDFPLGGDAVEAYVKDKLLAPPTPDNARVYLGVDAFRYPVLLKSGDLVESFDHAKKITITRDSWLVWLNDSPMLRFIHKTRYVIIEAQDGKTTVHEAQWWPMVNGEQSTWGADLGKLDMSRPFYTHRPQGLTVKTTTRPRGTTIPESAPPTTICDDPKPPGKRHALFVGGIDQAATGKDIKTFKSAMTAKNVGVQEADIITVEYDDTKPGTVAQRTKITANQIDAAFKKLKSSVGPNDEVIIYYTGHGQLGVWALGNDDKSGYYYEAAQIAAHLNDIQSDKIIIVNDACHSETMGTGIEKYIFANHPDKQDLHDKDIYVSYAAKALEKAGYNSEGGYFTRGMTAELQERMKKDTDRWSWTELSAEIYWASQQVVTYNATYFKTLTQNGATRASSRTAATTTTPAPKIAGTSRPKSASTPA